ncbi:lanthionine synthetase C family protein [Ascidiimonas aurantiaca]|uniref:lanthionine synthetase C family protein n=1 Tax=Ascidiimonas aurantiaca TaxID=1685432 RepID=UPI0030EC6A5B
MDQKATLEKKLEEISAILKDESQKNEHLGVLAGISGIALFNFYYSKYLDVDTYADIGVDLLNESVNRINEGYQYPTYCTGIAGAAWVFDHLVEEDFMDSENDELLAELDEFLYAMMESDMSTGNYDFLHAAIGYAFYFLKRFRNTKDDTLKEKYRQYLLNMLAMLEKTAQKDENGLKWESTLDIEKGTRGYNLSLSHGMSSIVIFLSKLHDFPDFREKAAPLLKGALDYILSKELTAPDRTVYFPSWITEPAREEQGSRLAWCYGDLGPGLALWRASKTLNDKVMAQKALEIFRHSAERTQPDDTGARDAGLCHGSYGNAQIFNRLYKETGEDIFKKAANFWIDSGIAMAVHPDGFAGYKQWHGMDKDWRPENNLLEGIAGIGLSIIDHLADFDTHWDECLMIS